MLDNLVFYYDYTSYDKITDKLRKIPHSFKIDWELIQIGDTWKKCFSILMVDPPLFINNFHSMGEQGVLRCFPLQIQWFNFVNKSLKEINEFEKKELEIMLDILGESEVKRWHYESTITIGRSQTIFDHIISPLQKQQWKILHLQPDVEKILFKDKFSLWHVVHPSRKIYIKGYVTNAVKYPKCFENMTKVELVLPIMNFESKTGIEEILYHTQRIRAELVSEELLKETRHIIWAKAMVDPTIFTWFNNSVSLSIAWSFLQFSRQEQEITPFPYIYISQEETLKILKEIKIKRRKKNESN